MRIRRLAFAGLGPFRAEQCVDFDRLEDVGVYLIAGRTGAGKSTILDAIAFALYGSVPRFDGTASRLRSDHSGPEDETFAELEFEAAGRVYRVRRSPEYERPKRRGTGTTTQPAKVELLEQVDGTWVGLSSSAKEVGADIGRIVGLTKDQFLQVILLAQNRFHEFLLAKNDDRQRLLRTLFATERFDLLRRRLLEQRDASAVGLEEERAAVTALADEAVRLLDDRAEPPLPDAAWFAGLPARLAAPLEAARAAPRGRRGARGRGHRSRRGTAHRPGPGAAPARPHRGGGARGRRGARRAAAGRDRARAPADGVLPLLRSARAAAEKERAAWQQRDLAADAYGGRVWGPGRRDGRNGSPLSSAPSPRRWQRSAGSPTRSASPSGPRAPSRRRRPRSRGSRRSCASCPPASTRARRRGGVPGRGGRRRPRARRRARRARAEDRRGPRARSHCGGPEAAPHGLRRRGARPRRARRGAGGPDRAPVRRVRRGARRAAGAGRALPRLRLVRAPPPGRARRPDDGRHRRPRPGPHRGGARRRRPRRRPRARGSRGSCSRGARGACGRGRGSGVAPPGARGAARLGAPRRRPHGGAAARAHPAAHPDRRSHDRAGRRS
ncbi:AAA family ATPase [Rathayibacter sp. VKM Ac-2762]|nr:AAA family ATPase [Rathayibacter sp. VKM Ac-2762]